MRAAWYEGLPGLLQLREDWLSLHSNADLYARFEWNLAAATHLCSPGSQLSYCRLADADGRAIAIIPVVVTPVSIRPLGAQVAATLGAHDHLAIGDFPLAPDVDVAEVAAAMVEALLERRWQVVSWPRVMARGNAARVVMALRDPRVVTLLQTSSPCNTFDTAKSAEAAVGALSRHMRSNLRNRRKRLSQVGPISVRSARESADAAAFFGEFLRIESSGWKGGTGTRSAIIYEPAARSFYESLFAQHSDEFDVDIVLLYCGENAVAAELLIGTARWQHVYKIGYDPAFAKYSPGQVLLEAVLERACGSEVIDRLSLVTTQLWHRDWDPVPEETLNIIMFRDRWRPALVRAYRQVRSWIRGLQHRVEAARHRSEDSAAK